MIHLITNAKIYALCGVDMLDINPRFYEVCGVDVIENGYVAWEDGKIVSVGPMAHMPAYPGAAVHDCPGYSVTPGFVDAHCHIGMWEDSLGFEGDDGNESTGPITPQLRALDAVNPQDRCFAEALAAGVTTVVTGPGSANPIAGQFLAMKTYGKRIDDMVLRQPCAMKMALGENPKLVYGKKGKAPQTRMNTAALIRETLYAAQEYGKKREKGDGEFNLKYESLLPVLSGELPVKFHAHRADDICTAMRLAREFGLRYSIEHATGALEILDILKEEKIPINCGPCLTDRSKPELKDLSFATPAALLRAGLPVATITDHPVTPEQYLPLCASLLLRHGVDEVTALKTITLYAARNCGLEANVGCIAPGMDADLAVFSHSPLSLAASPVAMVAGGAYIAQK